MFVQSNTIRATQNYVKKKLDASFSESEIRKIFKLIICKRLEWTDTDFILNQESRLSESDLLFVRSVINRILNGEPFQYILGETEFFGLTFFCSPAVLIPRPETEELVQEMLNTIEHTANLKIADLCTGSGCIGISLAKSLPHASLLLSDVSQEALEVARKSADINQVKVEFITHDILKESSFDSFQKHSYDVFVSNPPYIPLVDKAQIKIHVLEHEPHLALFVENENPLIFYQLIAENAREKLNPNGWLFFEINPDYSNELVNLLTGLGFVNIELMKDLQGRYRMLKAQNS
jgi:release factor glutamine methyltransferase